MEFFPIQHDIDELAKDLTNLEKNQIPFATALALTRTAQAVQKEEVEEIKKVFDRPTRFTKNAVYVKPARKDRLQAKVWLIDWAVKTKNPADKYLAPQIEGGERRQKGFEVLMQARGLLPRGYQAIPGKRARIDRYGNMSKGQINQILSFSNAQRDRYQNTKVGKRGTKARFIQLDAKDGKPGGIWAVNRGNGGIFPVMIFVKRTRYKKRYDFHGVAKKEFEGQWEYQLDQAFKKALATQKRRK